MNYGIDYIALYLKKWWKFIHPSQVSSYAVRKQSTDNIRNTVVRLGHMSTELQGKDPYSY